MCLMINLNNLHYNSDKNECYIFKTKKSQRPYYLNLGFDLGYQNTIVWETIRKL